MGKPVIKNPRILKDMMLLSDALKKAECEEGARLMEDGMHYIRYLESMIEVGNFEIKGPRVRANN